MSYWNYENMGASARPENKKDIQKIFEYIGITDRPGYSPYEERTFTNPAVYGCFYDEHKDNTGEFMPRVHLFGPDDLLYILNALFPKTKVYSHSAEGNDTSDTWENHSLIYDTDSMTLYGKDSYVSYSGDGPSGEQTWKERFTMKPPELKHIEVLTEISAADDNEEITGLLRDLLRKLKDGQIVYAEDPGDKRKVGEKYDVSGHVTEPEDEEAAFNQFYDSVIEKMSYHKFIELYKMDPDCTPEEDYRNALGDLLCDYEGEEGGPFDIDYDAFYDYFVDTYECKSELNEETYEAARKKAVKLFTEGESRPEPVAESDLKQDEEVRQEAVGTENSSDTAGNVDLSGSQRECLNVILELYRQKETLKIIDVANHMGKPRGTVWSVVKALSEKGILTTDSNGVITLC